MWMWNTNYRNSDTGDHPENWALLLETWSGYQVIGYQNTEAGNLTTLVRLIITGINNGGYKYGGIAEKTAKFNSP